MGKVTTFCLLSGCTPEIADTLESIFDAAEEDEEAGDLVSEAILTLINNDERDGIEDVTVIGPIHKNGEPISDEDMDKEEALRIPDSSLRIIPHCTMGDMWDFGSVSPPDPNPSQISYLVSFGTNIMIHSASLPILELATGGRMTPHRYWRLLMHKGLSVPHDECYGLTGIDYGEMSEVMEQFPHPTPGLSIEELIALEELDDVELIKNAIIHQGMFWIWMRPDRFPLSATPSDAFVPSVVQPPSTVQRASQIENLPLEILIQITSSLPFQNLLLFLSTSHHLRSKLLRFKSDRDAVARSWIERSAPWYLPVFGDDNKCDWIDDDNGDGEQQTGAEKEDREVIGWSYLRRCLDNPSMKNRGRIWRIAEQLERMADDMGVH